MSLGINIICTRTTQSLWNLDTILIAVRMDVACGNLKKEAHYIVVRRGLLVLMHSVHCLFYDSVAVQRMMMIIG